MKCPFCSNSDTKVIDSRSQDENSTIRRRRLCEKCGKPMLIKTGRFGQFMACSGFPECRNTKPIVKATGVKCPECGGDIIARRGKSGKGNRKVS